MPPLFTSCPVGLVDGDLGRFFGSVSFPTKWKVPQVHSEFAPRPDGRHY